MMKQLSSVTAKKPGINSYSIESWPTMLSPLPSNPSIKRFEITLQIETGNIIYEEFDDIEKAIEFLQYYSQNPQAILSRIKPKGAQ